MNPRIPGRDPIIYLSRGWIVKLQKHIMEAYFAVLIINVNL